MIEGTGNGVNPGGGTGGKTKKAREGSIEDLHAAPVSRAALPDPEELPEEQDGYGDVHRHGDDPPRRRRGRQPKERPGETFTGDGPPPKKKKGGKRRTTPIPMDVKHGKPQWPPRRDYHSGYDVAAKWIEEMKLRHPEFPTEVPGGEHVTQARNIFNQIQDPDNILAIIRLAIWDWEAIRESVEVWYTANKDTPNPTHILKILDQLGVNLKHGIISPAHRRSTYVARWIDGTWRDPRAPRQNGPSLAEQYRAGCRKPTLSAQPGRTGP